MITDLIFIKNMLEKENISYKLTPSTLEGEEGYLHLLIERGYIGFVTCITFDKYENFKDIGAYE